MRNERFFYSIVFILISGVGGLLLSLTGLSIGWMLGTLILAAVLSLFRPKFLKLQEGKGIAPYWLRIGQCILAIELGQKINLSIIEIFTENWFTIIVVLVLSIFFALLSGFILWKCSSTDMLTSFFGTAPGGLSAMPGIAEEVGANTGVVSIIQTMRVFLVVLTIPMIVSSWFSSYSEPVSHLTETASAGGSFTLPHIIWSLVLVLAAWGGYYIGKILRFPAPWLVGGMVTVALVQALSSMYAGYDLVAYWPHSMMILSQLAIAGSIGSRFHKRMFQGLKRTIFVAFVSTIGLIVAMLVCAFFVSELTGISLVTAALAFAPGGIAEMATTSVVLHADSTLVVAVQVLRIIIVCIMLPPIFRLLNHWDVRKAKSSHASA
ncbi:AbrB family transcriptional regulator [Priestia endophytica]|jgi:membrane AbrB-like protein|uniref:AbrB family transcriptional regulator n=1 Tax=Priestia endophytica TaxID=135735 RepID=UPI000DCA63BD|nr:AbrB family transcriptional regulator [Priestia endophytica]KAB2490549.1 AbrB family transcriptional regulator [Priestia endophytica]RAS81165.1 hypothetical protein A4R27_11435 [Priestia endophytica]RAS87626.1 hypothetical protein A4U60_06055 [Priestia endophytica]